VLVAVAGVADDPEPIAVVPVDRDAAVDVIVLDCVPRDVERRAGGTGPALNVGAAVDRGKVDLHGRRTGGVHAARDRSGTTRTVLTPEHERGAFVDEEPAPD